MPRHFKCEMLNDEKLKDLYSPFFQAVLTKVSSEWPLGFREFLRWSNNVRQLLINILTTTWCHLHTHI